MPAYRFCRSDDIALLADALNRCWAPYFPDEAGMTPAAFKRSIRDLQVWCSSCMVAFSGGDPIGVLIGARRPGGTLVHRIAVHPDHRRQGHGRHLLDSLASKLAILGPPRIVAEISDTLAPAWDLFRASGYTREAILTDYVLSAEAREEAAPAASNDGQFVIPVTVGDLSANGLLEATPPQGCWERSVETFTARADEIAGLAIASDERIEAYVLYMPASPSVGAGPRQAPDATAAPVIQIVSMRSFIDDRGARLERLLAQLRGGGAGTILFPRVHPAELPAGQLDALGFRSAGEHHLYAGTARMSPA